MSLNNKNHWETVYETKTKNQVSWTQVIPQTSLDFIDSFDLDKDAEIIDVGGGDSNLVDYLIQDGFKNITVLDISSKAIQRAKSRLGDKAKTVDWVVSDMLDFNPKKTFDVWHDRAAFHFLTNKEDIQKYVNILTQCVSGFVILGTFSKKGPKKCSGLDITQYGEDELTLEFKNKFQKIQLITEDHKTPFDTKQNFLFGSFKKCLIDE